MNLRAKITMVSVAGILLVATGLLFSGYLTQRQIEERFAEATILGKSVLWKKILASEFKAMENGISGLSRDRNTRDALKEGDRKALSESATTTFNLLHASHVLEELLLVNLQSEIMYSAPQARSGTTTNPLVSQALASGKIQQGVIRDDDNRPKVVVVFPLTIRGKAIGVGIYARSFKDAMSDFKTNDESDVMLYSLDGHLEADTNPAMAKQLRLKLPPAGQNHLTVVKLDKHAYSTAILPVLGMDKKPLAHLVSVKDYTESYARQQTLSIGTISGAIVIILVAMIGLYWFMGRSLKPLGSVVSNLEEIAQGNLTAKIEVTSRDEFGKLQAAMRDTVNHLRNMLEKVNHMTDQLADASSRMNQVTDETRRGLERQSSEVELVATAMNEMTATVQEVARHASHAAEAANNADKEARKGAGVVQDAIQSINVLAGEIERSTGVINSLRENSLSIGAILDVIRGIAEQTNLLALNAAIEAARAGEQGRGFAVVADEVRTLASRTQQSTQEIQGMIERLQGGAVEAVNAMDKSRSTASQNVELAAHAGDSLKMITAAVDTIAQLNEQIASASEEQSSVAEEINQNVVNINHVAEQSAEGALHTSRASEELQGLAEELRVLVNRFRL